MKPLLGPMSTMLYMLDLTLDKPVSGGSVSATFPVSVLKKKKSMGQLTGERIYLGSQFKDTVHHDEEVLRQKPEERVHLRSENREQWISVPVSLLIFYSVWDLSPENVLLTLRVGHPTSDNLIVMLSHRLAHRLT